MTASLTRSAAFLLGFGFAFLPSFGPFLAVLFFLTSRWRLVRADLLWLGAALLLAAPLAYHEGVQGAAFGLLQVAGPWLVYRAFFQVREHASLPDHSAAVTTGLVVGLSAVVGLGALQISEVNFAYKTLNQAVVWGSSPALYSHTVFVLGALIAVVAKGARLRLTGLGLSALGILVAGSREAAIAWVFVTAVLFLIGRRSSRSRLLELGLLGFMLVIAAGLGPLFGWGRSGFLLDIIPAGETRNLVQGSEVAGGDWWDATRVSVAASDATVAGETLTAYEVTKQGAQSWLRLQQVVPIRSGQPYTLSAWVQAEGEAQPGLQGWGQLVESGQTFALTGVLLGERWRVNVDGPGQILNAGVAEVEGEVEGTWRRVFVSFIYEGEQPTLYWYAGLAPDARTIAGTSARFAGFQLEPGTTLSPYTPGPATSGLSLGVARVPYWQAAWQGVKVKPLLGWGTDTFTTFYRNNWNNRRLREVPTHVHNFFLHVLFERGLVGLAGVLLLVAVLLRSALRSADTALFTVLLAVLFINVFDVTLFYGGVLYPLAAVAGWRAARTAQAEVRQSATRQLMARLSLATVDFATVYLAFAAALTLFQAETPLSSLAYGLLLWPVLAWREGLYPGYGLTAAQELRKQVTASLYAWLILAAGTVLFDQTLALSRAALVTGLALSTLALPLVRALTKRLLHRLELWGRPVYILGAGQAGRRVAKSLKTHYLDGLIPVAFFDDDPAKVGQTIEGVPVRGRLDAARHFGVDEGVRHVIVAVTRASPDLLTAVLRTQGRAFDKVQFIPDLSGLPTSGVTVSSLDKLLALEIQNELASPVNQAVKRMLDVIGVGLGGLLISPFVGLLALAVVLDSRGPVFYGHRRVGKDGRVFKAWKFRTMVPGADKILERHLAQNPALRAEWEATQKLREDPRVTRVGKFLRRYSLDELPQLWNILAGEMSLVGPRPIVTEEIPKYGKAFELYKMVTPGLTGYWQVSGRSDTSYEYRVELDDYYVRNWSVWLDLVILLRTPGAVLKSDGAY